MLRSLWISKTGMDAQQMNLDVITNNLANSSTTSFKRVQPMFQDLLYPHFEQQDHLAMLKTYYLLDYKLVQDLR